MKFRNWLAVLGLTVPAIVLASVTVTVNGTGYSIPQTNEKGWGTNVTTWIQAISANTVQPSGGLFTLSADLDLGAAFGLKSLYYKSRSSNVAGSGILRLANTDGVGFRNAGNTGDLLLIPNATDGILNYNGVALDSVSAVQTLSNKTLVAPVIGAATGTSLSVSGQLTSTVSTGTPPLVVSSTTQVANLKAATAANADTVTTNANLTGPITSVGNATSVASQTGTGSTFAMSADPTFTGTVNAAAVTASGTVTIGAGGTFSTALVDATAQTIGNPSTFFLTNYSGSPSFGPAGNFTYRGARNTLASPSALQLNDGMGNMSGRGYGATAFSSSSRVSMQFRAAENWSDTAQGTDIRFFTTPVTTVSAAERLRIGDGGNIAIGGATTTAAKLGITGGSDQVQLLVTGNGTQTSNLVTVQNSSAAAKFTVDNSGNTAAAGTISGTQLTSTIATGTAPFVVASTTQVANLTASNVITNANSTGDVTSVGNATTIASHAVTNAKAAQMAAHTIKGNNTGSTADSIDLTVTQVTADLNAMVGDSGSGGTKGLVPAPASGDAAAGKFLKADGTYAIPSPAVANYSVVAKTANYTLTTADNVVTAATAGGIFTLTLPTAVGNTGKTFYLKKTDSSFNLCTIATTSSQTFDGAGTTRTLATLNESWTVTSDGANWQVLVHKTATPWLTFSMTIGGSGSAPTKGTASTDAALWRRVGDSVQVRYDYVQSGAGAAGTGTYLFPLAGLTADTAKITVSSTGDVGTCGSASGNSNGTNLYAGTAFLYNSTNIGIFLSASDAKTYAGAGPGTTISLANATNRLSFIANVPIVNWYE